MMCDYAIESDEISVDIVEYFDALWFFREENGSATTKRFAIAFMVTIQQG